MKLINGDCLEEMDKLIEQGIKVDAIITDIPYGTTACKWDSVIPFDAMWERLNKLIKPNGAIVLFGNQPFTSQLINSNIEKYRTQWIWKKSRATNYVQARNHPMKYTEDIIVFSNNKINYNPQMVEGKPYKKIITNSSTKKHVFKDTREIGHTHINNGTRFPSNIIEIPNSNKNSFHSTQKPVALMEYLIKTYSCKDEVILDFTMGSGTTGVACKNLDRDFIGIELDEGYYKISCDRLGINEN